MALFHVDFHSEELGMAVQMDVILPQPMERDRQEGIACSPPYQTLYLLHGMSDDHTIWQRRTSIERYVQGRGLAVVMPTTHLGWYTDMHYGLNWFRYISTELPAICRSFFPLSGKREDTFAAGLSMGGYGAAKLGLTCGEKFSHVATLSGAVNIAEGVSPRANENGETPDEKSIRYWQSIFGPLDQVVGSENDLYALMQSRKAKGNLPRIYQACGTEDFLYEDNVAFRDALLENGYDVTYDEGPGAHNWDYWDDQIQKVLDWLPLKGNKADF